MRKVREKEQGGREGSKGRKNYFSLYVLLCYLKFYNGILLLINYFTKLINSQTVIS